MQEHLEVKTKPAIHEVPQEKPQAQIIDQKDLAVLWAIGILVSLLLSFAGASWQPARYEAQLSTSVDPTESRVENSQNKMVADALNDGTIEYDPSMDALIKLKPAYYIVFLDVMRLSLFPTGPLVIISLLIRKSVQKYKMNTAEKS